MIATDPPTAVPLETGSGALQAVSMRPDASAPRGNLRFPASSRGQVNAEEDRCPACIAGPSGIDGHRGLRARSLGSGVLSFKCEDCQSFWARTSKRGGLFEWSSTTQAAALAYRGEVLLPPCAVPRYSEALAPQDTRGRATVKTHP